MHYLINMRYLDKEKRIETAGHYWVESYETGRCRLRVDFDTESLYPGNSPWVLGQFQVDRSLYLWRFLELSMTSRLAES